MKKIFIAITLFILGIALTLFIVNYIHYSFSYKKDKQETYFVQLEWQSETIDSLRSSIQPLAQQIIEQGIKAIHPDFAGSNPSKDIPFYKAPPLDRRALSLYYIESVRHWHNTFPKMLLKKINAVRDSLPTRTFLKPEIAFFGDHQDELVILINDQTQELSKMNTFFKKAMREISALCKKETKEKLFNITKSERFPFVPHVSLGIMLSKHIKEKFLNNMPSNEQNNLLSTIKQKIIKAATPLILKEVPQQETKLHFTKLFLFARSTRNYEFKYQLKRENKVMERTEEKPLQ